MMVSKNYRKSTLLKRYVLYNLCFVLIPVMLLILIYWQSSFEQIVNEFETTQRYALKQVMKNIDGKLETIRLMANQLSYDPDLTPYQLQESKYGRYKAINRLKTYHSQANFLDEMILFIRGDDTLYSDKGVMSLDYFVNTHYQFIGDWGYGDFYGLIYDTPDFGFSSGNNYLSHKGTDRLAVLTYPWGNKTGRFGTIIGLIKAQSFEQLLTSIESDIDNALFILNSKGEILFSSQHNVEYSASDISNLIQNKEEISRQKIGNRTHSVIITQSDVNGWIYISVFPNTQFAARLINVKKPILAIISVILIICIATGVLLAFRNYVPIHRITMFLRQMTPQKESSDKKAKDELKEISKSIKVIINNNEGMKNQIEENRAVLAEQFLYKILTSNVNFNSPKFTENLKNLGIDLSGPYFSVIVFKPPRKLVLKERESVKEAIGCIKFKLAHYCVEMDYQGCFAIILNSDTSDKNMLKAVQRIKEELSSALNIEPILGIGHTYNGITMLNRSFTEAVSAAEAAVHSGNLIAFFDELKTRRHSSPYWYPTKAQLRLIQGLNQGNRVTVEESIAELSELFHTQKLDSDAICLRFMAFGIVQEIWPIVEKMKLEDGNEDIDLLIHHTDINDFLYNLKRLCFRIIDVIESQTKNEEKLVFDEIINYIDMNYMNQNLSLKGLASRFDMTDSYLSRFFRNNSGMNFIDYLTKKRMDEACRLLCKTDLLVKDVMERVGYIDLASFSRKFKQIYGVSPGKYREQKNQQMKKNIIVKESVN